jgi:RNA polymerase sigma-70 factor (ECF subfamily)
MEEIASLHYETVFRFCVQRVGEDVGADAAQETFLTAQKVAHKFRGDSAIRTWLLGIANNECRRLARIRRVQPLILDPEYDAPSTIQVESQVVTRTALLQALAKLSEEHREVVFMHELDELTYAEIAEILGIPEGTVKSRLHHAFLAMKKHLDPQMQVTP